MSITDARMAWGEFSLDLKPDTPADVLEQLRLLEAPAMGALVRVFPGRVDADAVTSGGADALFTGVYLHRPSRYQLSGFSATCLLGEASDGKRGSEETGPLQTGAAITGNYTINQWLDACLAGSGTNCAIRKGTVTSGMPAGTLHSGTFFFATPKTIIDTRLTAWFGVQYRVNPDLSIDVGPAADLWPEDPNNPKVAARRGVPDVDVTAIDVEQIDLDEDFREWASGVVTNSGIVPGIADMGTSNPFRNPGRLYGSVTGVTYTWRRYVTFDGNDDTPTTAEMNSYADAILTRQTGRQRAVTISANEFALPDKLVPGEVLNVWDPFEGFYDLSNVVRYLGKDIYPVRLRVTAMTYPIQKGMSVWFDNRANLTTAGDGSDVDPLDLTPYIAWEDGPTSVTVGAPPRTLGSRRRFG